MFSAVHGEGCAAGGLVADSCRVSWVCGRWCWGWDVGNVTGVRDILDAVEGFAEFWRSAVRENEREVREEVWRRWSWNGPRR